MSRLVPCPLRRLTTGCELLVLSLSAAQLPNQHVRQDPATGNLRVSFRLDDVDRSILVPLPNHVAPKVAVSFDRRENTYSYKYTITNATTAEQPITEWHLIANAAVHIYSIGQPDTWGHDEVQLTSTDPDSATYVGTPGLNVRWAPKTGLLTDASSGSILAGLSQGPFSIACDGRPGFVTSTFRSFVDRREDDPVFQLPPDAEHEALAYVNNFEKSGVTRMVLGPAFGRTLSPAEVAAGLAKQLQQMVEAGQLPPSSEFLMEVIAVLKRQAERKGRVVETLRHRPGTPTEGEIATVLREDLNIRY